MFVMHVINNLVVGGAERFLLQLSSAQVALGWRVGLLTLVEPNPLATEVPRDLVEYRCLGRGRLNDPRLLNDTHDALEQALHDIAMHPVRSFGEKGSPGPRHAARA